MIAFLTLLAAIVAGGVIAAAITLLCIVYVLRNIE